jgi:hypothetical protein
MSDITNYMDVYRTEPEYTHTLDEFTPIRIDIAAMGGGELGRSYENNRWIYSVWEGDTLVMSHDDMHCSVSVSHYAAACMVIDWLLNHADDSTDEVEAFVDSYRDELEMLSNEILTVEHANGISTHLCDYGCEHREDE